MSALRQRLKRPETYLAAVGVLVALAALDSCRSPASQVAARLYVGVVRVYQALGRPLLEGRIQCRYRPTCSEFSILAVREHGIRRGLELTVTRIRSCTRHVPIGTYSPRR
jgi:putative component of membrane protein insertase Oxa1/YidC/SpoIIIJ protein YidD